MNVKFRTVLMVLFVACFAMSCKKDNVTSSDDISVKGIEFEDDEITLYEGATYDLELMAIPTNADLPKCNFTSDDKSVATVSKTSGKVTAVSKGEAIITATTSDGRYSAECYVTVLGGGDPPPPPPPPPPGDGVYREPYLKFGASVSTVKSYETRGLAGEDSDGGYDFLMYFGENNDVFAVFYEFENGKLFWDGVCLNETSNIEKRVMDFLSKSYQYMEEENGFHYFISSDQKIFVVFYYYYYEEYQEGHWYVEYIDTSVLGKSATPAKNPKKFISKLNMIGK